MVQKIFGWITTHNLDLYEIIEFSKKLDDTINNVMVNIQYTNINTIRGWFEQLRTTLRVGRHLSQNGSETAPSNAQNLREDFEIILTEIYKEGEAIGGSYFGEQDRLQTIASNTQTNFL